MLTKSWPSLFVPNRWTGANSLLWTERPHTLTLSLMEQRTTWAIPTPLKVFWKHWIRLHTQHPRSLYIKRQVYRTTALLLAWPLLKKLIVSVLTGAYYNIIRVPPTKDKAEDTLEGATVLCSIPSVDKSKPSYYHSFGEQQFSYSNQSTLCFPPRALTIHYIHLNELATIFMCILPICLDCHSNS